MKSIEELKLLEKQSDVEICCSEIIADDDNEETNTRTRILLCDDKYYYHKMKNGNVVECFGVMVDWKPFDGKTFIFCYTPDDIHIYTFTVNRMNEEMQNRKITNTEAKEISHTIPLNGLKCVYNGITIKYIDPNKISINDKVITVEADSGFTYKFLKRKIKANDGANGFYRFLDKIAEQSKFEKFPLFSCVFETLKEKYAV